MTEMSSEDWWVLGGVILMILVYAFCQYKLASKELDKRPWDHEDTPSIRHPH